MSKQASSVQPLPIAINFIDGSKRNPYMAMKAKQPSPPQAEGSSFCLSPVKNRNSHRHVTLTPAKFRQWAEAIAFALLLALTIIQQAANTVAAIKGRQQPFSGRELRVSAQSGG